MGAVGDFFGYHHPVHRILILINKFELIDSLKKSTENIDLIGFSNQQNIDFKNQYFNKKSTEKSTGKSTRKSIWKSIFLGKTTGNHPGNHPFLSHRRATCGLKAHTFCQGAPMLFCKGSSASLVSRLASCQGFLLTKTLLPREFPQGNSFLSKGDARILWSRCAW